MADLNESLIKALQSIDSNKAISDKFKSCSKENVYSMLKENGYDGSTQEFENLLSNIEKEIGDLLMQRKSDKDLNAVSGGKGANYFKKGLALGLTALSVGGSVQQGTFAAEVNQNANTKSFGEKAKEFFSKAKGKVSSFVDAHPGATLLLALGATNAVTGLSAWGLTKRHYNKTQDKTQAQIKQEISGTRAQLLATCKNVIGVESTEYEQKIKTFETTVDSKINEFKFGEDLKVGDIKVGAVNEFKALFGDINAKDNAYGCLLGVTGGDLSEYITNIRTEITKKLQNDSSSKFYKLTTAQLEFLSTVVNYAENVVMLKQVERVDKISKEVAVAKETIENNLNSIQDVITAKNEEAFGNPNGDKNKATAYKAVVAEVRKGFEKVLTSVFGSLAEATKIKEIEKVMTALTFFEENIIASDNKLVDLKSVLPVITEKKDGKTVLTKDVNEATVKALASAANLKGFVNVILGELKKGAVADETSGLIAKFKVVKDQKDFLSSEEKSKKEEEVKLIAKITKLLTIDGLAKYENKVTEFENLGDAKKAFVESEFVRKVDGWVTEFKKNQGDDKIFAGAKLEGIKNLSGRLEGYDGTIGEFAGAINNVFNALITDVKGLFDSNDNFNEPYKAVVGAVKDTKPGIFADEFVDGFKVDKGLFAGVKKAEKKFEVNNEGLKNLYKDNNSLADNLENIGFTDKSSTEHKLKKDNNNDNGLNNRFGGNAENLKVLLFAMVGADLFEKLKDAFNGFGDLEKVEISKAELEKTSKDDFSYKFFAKLSKVEGKDDEDIKAFKTWITGTVGLNTTDGNETITKTIWNLIEEAGTKG